MTYEYICTYRTVDRESFSVNRRGAGATKIKRAKTYTRHVAEPSSDEIFLTLAPMNIAKAVNL